MLILSCSGSIEQLTLLLTRSKKGCCITDRSENLGQGSTYLYPIGT